MPIKNRKKKRHTRGEKKRAKLQQKNSRTSSINIIPPCILDFTQREINELLNPVPRQERNLLVTNFSNPSANEIDDELSDFTLPCSQKEPLIAYVTQRELEILDLKSFFFNIYSFFALTLFKNGKYT